MKTFNWRIALRVLLALIAYDGVLLALGRSENTLITVLWWLVNFPGFPLLYVTAPVVQVSGAGILIMVGAAGVFSTCLWSLAAGYVFRRAYAPN